MIHNSCRFVEEGVTLFPFLYFPLLSFHCHLVICSRYGYSDLILKVSFDTDDLEIYELLIWTFDMNLHFETWTWTFIMNLCICICICFGDWCCVQYMSFTYLRGRSSIVTYDMYEDFVIIWAKGILILFMQETA